MDTPWLVQRGKLEDTTYKKGFDAVVSLDYMGSAEFEFGEIPKALKRIRENIAQYKVTRCRLKTIPKYPHPVYIISKVTDLPEVEAFLKEASTDPYKPHLKEAMNFSYLFCQPKPLEYIRDIDFWWDIVNDWMCFVNKNKAMEKLCAVLPGLQP